MERGKTLISSGAAASSGTMKGLQLFIADLRSVQQSQEQEKRIQSELAKIRQHFASAEGTGSDKLGGYQRKKYVAKLAYIYIVSNTTKLNEVLFGIPQVIKLLQSGLFSEKSIAYMTLEMLYGHQEVVAQYNDEIMFQVIKDLSHTNDDIVGLALNFVGIVGKLTDQLALNNDLVTAVFQILRSPTSSSYLKKRSAISFLVLLKENPNILTEDTQRKNLWIQRILSLMDDTENYRVMLAALPLVIFIAKIDSTPCIRLLPQLTDILHRFIVDNKKKVPSEYMFCNIPNPWLITKIISLLDVLIVLPSENNGKSSQVDISNIDQETLGKLRLCITKVLDLATSQAADPMERITRNTLLFSMIKFAPKLDPSKEAISNSVTALCSLLTSPEINIRYLTLDSLVRLCFSCDKATIKTARQQILSLLPHLLNNERDLSLARKIIELLYTLTDAGNVVNIVDELLNVIATSRLSNDPNMKSDVAVKVAVLTEKYATNTQWFITASLRLLSLSSNTSFNDDLIWQRLCQIVVNNPPLHKITCEELFRYMSEKSPSESIIRTAAFLLGEYGNLISDLATIGDLFNIFAERYFQVSNSTKAMILTTIVKLYRFGPEIGSVAIKFFQLELNSLDIELQTRSFEYLKIIQISKMTQDMDILAILFSNLPAFNTKTNPLLKRLGNLTQEHTPIPESLTVQADTHDTVNDYYIQQTLSANWKEGFTRMITHRQGVLYTSSMIRVLYRIAHTDVPTQLQIALTFVNQAEWAITGISSEILAHRLQGNPEYVLRDVKPPSSRTIEPHKRATQTFSIIIRKSYSVENGPIAAIHFNCGNNTSSAILKLGVGITSTITETPALTLPEFVARWKALSDALGPQGEAQLQLQTTTEQAEHNLARIGFHVVKQTTHDSTVFAAAIVHAKSDGNFGCLVKIAASPASATVCTLTCKTTTAGGTLAQDILSCLKLAAAHTISQSRHPL